MRGVLSAFQRCVSYWIYRRYSCRNWVLTRAGPGCACKLGGCAADVCFACINCICSDRAVIYEGIGA